jgi:tetratricopeptide (TPR) repeat protein
MAASMRCTDFAAKIPTYALPARIRSLNALRTLLKRDPAAALQAARQRDPSLESEAGESDFIAGAALYALGRDDEAESTLRNALRENPLHRLAGTCLADLLRNRGRYRAATEIIDALVASAPADPAFALQAIHFLRGCQQDVAAERIWRSTQTGAGPDSFYVGGLIAMTLGDFATARERLDRCIGMDPNYQDAILARVHAGASSLADGFDAYVHRVARNRQSLSKPNRVALDFALGKLALDRGEIANAFEHYDRANKEQLELIAEERSAARPLIDPPRRPDPSMRHDASGDDVVLIVGMPRSGTTLLAARLGQHPQIADRSELPWLGMLGRKAISADTYLRHLRQDDAPRVRYIDKNPLNFRFLDAAAREFPRVRVLHCRRDPRDVAVSCYTQFFPHPDMEWSCDWNTILEFQQRYRTLIEQRPRDIAWMDVDYRNLVEAPESTLQAAVDFLGLDWNDSVLATPVDGVVNTASVWQARQPMHGRSLGRWRATASCTRALLAAYGDHPEPHNWFQP